MKSLAEWLSWQESLHLSAIQLGLERVRVVAQRLNLERPAFPIITVAGTNGKGSTCAMLTACLTASGYAVGTYTSPHLLRYNERICLNNQPVTDEEIVQAFECIEQARADTPLTYFEYGTLAAMVIFAQQAVDIAVLEVGLGGRLDAVNVWDAEIAIVTSIGIDHVDWLGHTRELIGAEKAAIGRPNKVIICGDPEPPASIQATVDVIGARLWQLGRDFSVTPLNEHSFKLTLLPDEHWKLPNPALAGLVQLNNAACVVVALRQLAQTTAIQVSSESIAQGIASAQVLGRLQKIRTAPDVWVDVAHNGHAAQALNAWLNTQTQGVTHAVFSILNDKDAATVISTLDRSIATWHIVELSGSRATPLAQIEAVIKQVNPQAQVFSYQRLESAYQGAISKCSSDDRVVAFGSFLLVSGLLSVIASQYSLSLG